MLRATYQTHYIKSLSSLALAWVKYRPWPSNKHLMWCSPVFLIFFHHHPHSQSPSLLLAEKLIFFVWLIFTLKKCKWNEKRTWWKMDKFRINKVFLDVQSSFLDPGHFSKGVSLIRKEGFKINFYHFFLCALSVFIGWKILDIWCLIAFIPFVRV